LEMRTWAAMLWPQAYTRRHTVVLPLTELMQVFVSPTALSACSSLE
jgi:hypothetical protein